jgi:formylglycine-generating enzyme required for sulfatase activity
MAAATADPRTSIDMKFAWVPPGNFLMGANPKSDDEKPSHLVTISHGFYLGVTPVTQAQWESVLGYNPSHFTGDVNRPVENVSWDDCQVFCEQLRELTGKPIRLPTEAEWEYACHAGSNEYYSGNGEAALKKVGWYAGNSNKQTQPVAKLAPNDFGLYDLHGNVWEWCQDWYGSYASAHATDPTGPDSGSVRVRVLRGGSWGNDVASCRAAYRSWDAPSARLKNVGFRVVFRLD